MVITQSVTIPANRRLTIDVPPEVPAGPMIISFAPVRTNRQGTPVFGRQFWMTEDFDTLPTEYIGEVIDFVGYLQQKTRQNKFAGRTVSLEKAAEMAVEDYRNDKVLTAFAGQESSENNNDIRLTKKELDEMLQSCPHTLALSGILSGMGDVDLDEIRMERLARHL